MAKTLVVFGATGNQGGSVVDFVLNDPELSKEYTIRAITRDPSSTGSKALQAKNVEVVRADLNDEASLVTAMEGANTVFALTMPAFEPNAREIEMSQGRKLADAAVTAHVQYMIFSTLPNVSKISGGKYTKVYAFDAKAELRDYILQLPIKSAFFAPGSFMQNLQTAQGGPHPTGNGDYVFSRPTSPQTRLPLIDIAGDAGKFVGAILAEPDKYEGKVFCSATALYSLEEMAAIMSKSTGKTIRYQQIDETSFRKYLPPFYQDVLFEMMLFQEEFGYYGPGTEELVAWAAENAREKPKTFEQYLKEHPLQLQ